MQRRSEKNARFLGAVDSALGSRPGHPRGMVERYWSRVCLVWAKQGPTGLLYELWMRFWMIFAGRGFLGRMASRLAACVAPPYYDRLPLAWMNRRGYVSPTSTIHHKLLRLGDHVLIDDRVLIHQGSYQGVKGGEVTFGRCVRIMRDVIIQTGDGGRVEIGEGTYIHPRCIISGYKGSVVIGKNVQVAANCSFYPYNHGLAPGIPIDKQPLTSSGDVVVGDEAWIGTAVTILEGVRIGKGAVIGAGSVVTRDIPDNAIACGIPARVIRMRGD